MDSLRLHRPRIFLALLVLTIIGLAGCTYVWRREYRLPGSEAGVSAAGWSITPRIIARNTYDTWQAPVEAPSEFAITFRAAMPRPARGDSLQAITDLRIDSAYVTFRLTGAQLTWRFNEAAWVSYPAISPDTLVKTFRVVQNFGELDWQTIPSGGDTLQITLFTTTHTGVLMSMARTSNATVAIDTALWRPRDEPPVNPPPVTLWLERRDFLMAVPGFRVGS
ncbi:MAG: hypothetical protein AB1644_11140 [Candidatus Zixiibacteriota bacterium]